MTNSSVQKVLHLIQSGRQAEIEAAGVPVVDVAPGATAQLNIDLTDVMNRIDGMQEWTYRRSPRHPTPHVAP